MNTTKKLLFFSIIISLSNINYCLNSMITFFLHQYPTVKASLDNVDTQKYSKKLQQPGYLHKKIIKHKRIHTGIQGIMSMYLGYVSLSDANGQVIFPRKQIKSEMNFLITQGIQPVFMIAPTTINNWMLDPSKPAEMYKFDIHQDPTTDLYYIETTKIDLPQNNVIELNTIILIADPKNVYIPEGATLTNYSPNLVLPNIYIKKNFNFTYNALYTLSIKQYFEQIDKENKQEEQTVSTLIKQ